MAHRLLPITALAVLAAAPALAGGFTEPIGTPAVTTAAAVPVAVAPSSDWSGFYAGGQLGFGDLSSDLTFNEAEIGTIQGDGSLYGVHAGYMRDFGRFVVGGELDWDMTGIGLADGTETECAEVDSITRARLRLGFDAGRVLPYVTAGAARASFGYDGDAVSASFRRATLAISSGWARASWPPSGSW